VVEHATEVALGILMPGVYFPKREAMDDARGLVEWYDGSADAQ
jgi:hypothetical protein